MVSTRADLHGWCRISCAVRTDWLRERVFFDKLSRKDGYAKARLGYSAPNIFVLSLSNY